MARDFPYVYPYSAGEALRLGETQRYDDSFRLNVSCARDIEQAIRDYSNDAEESLNAGCAQSILDKYGFKRVSFVLANSLKEMGCPHLLSGETRQWLSETYVSSDGRNNRYFAVDTAASLLESFVAQTREAYAGLGLFGPEHCVGNRNELDYTGKVLVMNPDTLRESCWDSRNILWYAHDGFGCDPHAIGRSIRCTCLGDGEQTRWNRGDFIGVLDERFLPDWAVDALSELRGQKMRLSEQDISFAEEISEVGNLLNFYMETNFDVDAVFGTNVCTPENDDWLNVYANYDMESGQLCDELEIALHRGDGSEESLTYPLSTAEKEIILRKMDDYCRQQTGQSLTEYSAQMLAEDFSPRDSPVMQ